jgi:zinc protease
MKKAVACLSVSVLLAGILLAGCGEKREVTTARKVLTNGLTVVVRENGASDVASMYIFVRDGALFETPDQAGAANLLRTMLFSQTDEHAEGGIQRAIEGLGGRMLSSAAHDFVQYSFTVPSDGFYKMLDLVAEGLAAPVFEQEELDRNREKVLDGIEEMRHRPVDRAYRLCLSELMGDHPYGRLADGDPATLPGITLEDLRKRFEERYVGPNIIVAVAGKLDPRTAADRVGRAMAVIRDGETAAPAAGPVKWPTESVRTVERADVARTAEVLGFPGPSIADRDNITMDVLLVALMEGKSSRLNMRLKEELGLVYAVGAGWYTQRQPSPLFIWMELPTKNVTAAEKAVVQLLQEMASQPVSEDELAKARVLLEAGNLRMTETAEGQAFYMGYWNSVGDEEFANTYAERLASVTAAEVQRAAERYLGSGIHATAIVEPE